MKRIVATLLLFLAIVPSGYAEQCKSCNFSTGSIVTFLVALAVMGLLVVFLISGFVFLLLNRVQQPRNSVWTTFAYAMLSAFIGLVLSFRLHGLFFISVFAFVALGAVIGYFLSPLKKDKDDGNHNIENNS